MSITIQTVSEVPECPFWYGIYSNITVIKHCLTGSLLAVLTNRRNLCFFPVNIRARPLARLHEISTARDWFQILLCPNRTHICFLRDGTFFKFPQSILTANLVHMAFFNQLDVIKTSKAHCSLSPGRIFEWPQFPKLRLLRRPKLSQTFSPLRLGSARGLASGCGLLRQHTAARGSLQRPRFRGPAAPGGEGGRGCGEPSRPWPRRRRYWWGNLMRPWDSVVRKWRKMLMFHWWFHFLVESVFTIFGKRVHTFAPMFGVVVCEHHYIVPTLWDGVFLTQGF